MTTKLYFKCLPKNLKAHGDFKWPALGVWTKKLDKVSLCSSGYHLTCLSGITRWLNEYRPMLFLAEGKGRADGNMKATKDYFGNVSKGDKIAVAQARLLRALPTDRNTLYPIWKFAHQQANECNKNGNGIFTIFLGTDGKFGKENFFDLVATLEKFLRIGNKSEKKIAIDTFRRLEIAWDISLGLPKTKEVYR